MRVFANMSMYEGGLIVALLGLGCTFLVLVLVYFLVRLLKRF
jgi:hypothetical protein